VELLVATWSIRLALGAALAVAVLSISAGMSVIDAVDRAVIAAFVFTLVGRLLIGFLETPEQRLARLRAARDRSAAKTPARTTARDGRA